MKPAAAENASAAQTGPGQVAPAAVQVWRRDAWTLPVLLGVTALVYSGTLFGSFVWDDARVVLPAAARSPLAAFRSALAGVTVERVGLGYFRPLLEASYALDGWVWGMRPFGFHLTNLLLYGVCVALAYRLARHLLPSRIASLTASLVFALHPVHVEPVAWIQGRGDLLAFAGVAAALLAFRRSLRAEQPWPWRVAAGAAALLGMLVKESALVAPLLAAAWWLLLETPGRAGTAWPPGEGDVPAGGRVGRLTPGAVTAALAPLGVALVLYGAMRLASQEGPRGLASGPLTPTERWLVLLPAFGRYIRLLLYPLPLNAYHMVPVPTTLSDAGVAGGGSLLAGLLVAAIWASSRAPRLAFALWWFLLTLLPVLPVGPIKGFVMAERYLLLPSFGFALGLGLLAERVWIAARTRVARGALALASAALLLFWIGVGMARIPDWVEPVEFYRAMVRTSPNSALAHSDLGGLLVVGGQIAEGIHHLERALALKPDMAFAHAGLGIAHWRLGDRRRAVAALETAAHLRTQEPRILALLAAALEAQGRWQEEATVRSQLQALLPSPADVSALIRDAQGALLPSSLPHQASDSPQRGR
jgi:tetratricopeptide (TPR) repeat protein